MIKVTVDAKLLSAESKPYDFNGNSGTSHKVRLSVEGEIYVCKSTAEQVSSLQSKVGVDGEAVILFDSRKETLTAKLESFVE